MDEQLTVVNIVVQSHNGDFSWNARVKLALWQSKFLLLLFLNVSDKQFLTVAKWCVFTVG